MAQRLRAQSRALGITSYLPREERHSRSKDDLERYLCSAMGGRAADDLRLRLKRTALYGWQALMPEDPLQSFNDHWDGEWDKKRGTHRFDRGDDGWPTAEEFGKALDNLEKQGMQALLLDLRNNPGGLLNSAVDVLGQFLPPNTKVVSTQGRVSSQKHDYSTPAGVKERTRFPLVVLVNEGSASGSEIVAGALKDLHRGIVVGETTFGKGSVQNVMQLPDGSALRFTTAKTVS
jgi:hypothetical protein